MAYGSLPYGLGTYKGGSTSVDTLGHIGAFHFGTASVVIDFGAPVWTFSAETSSVVVSINADASFPAPFFIWTAPTITPLVLNDFDVVISSNVHYGTSPLVVDFTATVSFNGGASGLFKVTKYYWYFDYDNYPTVYETSTSNTITHVYLGYRGQKYKIRCFIDVERA